ncbi:MAG TPA: fibronectin type III domain-containing protein [Pyrinomonadaceae bacterium]|nr:fibronectin type III domain-containing protein [Pyrinomonadaceae bacterium]
MITKVSLSFAALADYQLDNFAQGVIDSLTGNATYPTPPVTLANLQTAVDDFSAKVTAARTGGTADTAAKRNSRQALLGMLRQVATYVQLKCNNDPELLLSSGFEAQSMNRTSVPLEKPSGLKLKNGNAGQLEAKVEAVKNTNMYEGRCKLDTGDWLPSVFSGDSQHIVFNGLTPGKMYTIEIRCLGGSTGQSDWSDPSSHMAI